MAGASPIDNSCSKLPKALPLPKGEGRGEGKRVDQTFAILEIESRLAILLFLFLMAVSGAAHAQKLIEGKSLKFPDYYPAPHQSQLKSLVEGARVQPQPSDIYLVTEAKVQTFREDGSPEMIITAPQCIYNGSSRIISSEGPLHGKTADDAFSIEGEGFSFQTTNSALSISNKVHTQLDPDLLQPKTSKATPNDSTQSLGRLNLWSDRFDYSEDSGLGVYRENVRLSGTNMNMTSGLLTVVLPMKEHQKPSEVKTIIAETNVIMDYLLSNQEKVHATGERVTYATDTSLARLTGHPTWRAGQREGHGDELIIDRTERIFLVNGQAYFKTPVRTNETGGFLPQATLTTTNITKTTNQFIEVTSDNYEFRTNMALFGEDVHVTEKADDQLKGKMTCRTLTLNFSGTNELQRMLAEDKVVIEEGDNAFRAGKAIYEGPTGILELVDNPSWKSGPREGKGDLIQLDVKRKAMDVKGNAFMRLPAQEIGETADAKSSTKEPSTTSATNQFAELFSDEYELTEKQAQFDRNVRIDHPRMKWSCEKMTAFFPPPGEKNQKLVAEEKVVFDLTQSGDQPERKAHGTAEKVVYDYSVGPAGTNDVMQMTGSPVLQTDQGIFENSVIIFDHAGNTLSAPGKYKIHGTVMADVIELPTLKLQGRKRSKK